MFLVSLIRNARKYLMVLILVSFFRKTLIHD